MLLALVTACVGDSNYYVGACAGRNSSGNFSGDTGTVEARDASLQLRTTASVTDSVRHAGLPLGFLQDVSLIRMMCITC